MSRLSYENRVHNRHWGRQYTHKIYIHIYIYKSPDKWYYVVLLYRFSQLVPSSKLDHFRFFLSLSVMHVFVYARQRAKLFNFFPKLFQRGLAFEINLWKSSRHMSLSIFVSFVFCFFLVFALHSTHIVHFWCSIEFYGSVFVFLSIWLGLLFCILA